MSIQQNINQLATIGAALYTQTPQFEELKQKKVEKGLEKEAENKFIENVQNLEGAAKSVNDPGVKVNLAGDVKEAALDLYKRTGNPEILSRGYNVAHNLQQKYEKELEFRDTGKMNEQIGNAANMRAQTQHEAIVKQKANIKSCRDELLNMPTSLGGKLKDLSPELQETLIKEYEKNGK